MTAGYLAQAEKLARRAHRGQLYQDGNYTRHLERVVAGCRRMGYTDDLTLTVAWLHDVVEDTAITLIVVEKKFGIQVAAAVGAMTRRLVMPLDEQPGHHESIHAVKEPFDMYLARVIDNPTARIVKWADACDNLLMCQSISPSNHRSLAKKYLETLDYLKPE